MPPSENLSCRVIDFEKADVVSLMIYPPPPPMLVVAGEKLFANTQVSLNPRHYVQKPEYWGIEVVGCTPAIGQPAIVPYVVELDLTGHVGTRGIEVIGANHTERIELAAAAEGTPPETAVDETPA
ncbi:hypothetical protein Areg01_47190 [Actinoplanes regularis]|nr:hypothetical protein Areg01_47190 [Actinoplanes regularis]